MLRNFKTFQLALQFHKETKKVPLRGEIKDQLERASLSVALNLAEGSGKESPKERRRFYSMAFCSIREIQAICAILENQELSRLIDPLAAHCYKLIAGIHKL